MRKFAWAVAGALLVSGCTGSKERTADNTLTVFAAASLKKPFTQFEGRFEEAHPGVDVVVNFAGSSDLAAQLRAGARADVVATADERTMNGLERDHIVTGPATIFARNALALIVPKDNPRGVTTLTDVTQSKVKLVACAPNVPCGAAMTRLEAQQHLSFHPVSQEQSVSGVLAKVVSGDADAGFVYASDAKSAGGAVHEVSLGSAAPVENRYPIALGANSSHAQLAWMFSELVQSAQGESVLAEAGFLPPSATSSAQRQ